jgi:ribosomal protein S18 acetylase RimI-like enzyme
MHGPYSLRALKDGDAAVDAAARAFARASLYERLWLHAALEIPPLRERSELFAAFHCEHAVGLAAVIEGLLPHRVAALDGVLPGVASKLLARVTRPFVCPAPLRLACEIARAGGRPIRQERQMVRLDRRAPLPDPDPRVERLCDAGEIARFCGQGFAPLELEIAPFLGIRDPYGELAAVVGARFLSPRVALMAHLETREDCRRMGYARALASGLVRALESEERHIALFVKDGEQGAMHLFAELGFRGTHEFRVFAF